ncbi:putative branched-chain amino acid permease [Methanomethylovorans hollandica DSM 15978]|jgi:branched-subunit amino acid transport protein AzlD|uniref:Putative branched-chain amino acid permease n=1 Tax=Methanomethylovorans hollandica (strain DSM 15978 / NBRC 107637 / DMS1) TaxID=867904 RepID=L0KXD8_METHD|nr:branched-chain amino acid transporter permease [Methanomethylovorans hollandica]AGB50127.1 putative branched-chain amino acid permease [Methanomethylovorans hollandica DSM 15978]
MTNETLYLLAVITVVAIATFITRILPFILFNSKEPPGSMSMIERNLPPMILLLLVFYCLKDVQWFQSPYGSPEIFAIAVVTVLHVWKRNAMLSIFIGTGLYMLLIQYDIFELFFS